MTIDIGAETLGASVTGPALEKGWATKRECIKTGNCHELSLTLDATNKCTGVKLGIRTEVAGAVGVFLGETPEILITELKAETVTGIIETADVALVSGVSYFLCIVPVKGSTLKVKATEKAGWGFKTTGVVKKVSEGTWTTAENKAGEPMPVWGIEAEGAILTARFTVTFNQKDTIQATQLLAAKLQEQMVLRDTFSAVQTTVANFVSRMELKDSFQATAEAKLLASINDKMVLGFGLTPAQAQSIAMTDQMKFQMTVKAKFNPTEAGKRVTIFIFEE